MKKILNLLKLQFAFSVIIILLSASESWAQTTNRLYLDYSIANWDDHSFLYNFNSLFSASDSGVNYAAVAFNSYNGSEQFEGIPSGFAATPTGFILDSLFIILTHQNNSGLYDHIVVEVVSLIGDTQPSSSVLWQWEDSTNISLGTGGYMLSIPVHISMSQPFGVVFKYYDPSFLDTCGIIGGYVEDGIGGPAMQSMFQNSWMKYPPNYNSIIKNSSIGYGNPVGSNGWFYGENWTFIALIDSAVFPPCSAGFSMHPDTTSAHTWFALNTATGVSPLGYDWTWGDGSTATGATPTHTYSSADYYPICLTVTDAVGCTSIYCDSSTYLYKTEEDMSMVTVNVVTELPNGIESIKTSIKSINIFPNTAQSEITIESSNGFQFNQISVTDILGREISFSKFKTQISKSTINLQSFSSGIYFIKVQMQDGNVLIKKFMKQ